METRSTDILNALIREFIMHGEPVSSGWLFDHYDFGIRPAMIRAELNDLAERGFLEQPHHSAGRVPKDKGYEHFARHAILEEPNEVNGEFAELFADNEWGDLVELLSAELGALTVVRRTSRSEMYKNGLEALIEHLDWNSRAELTSVIRDFEELDERVEKAKDCVSCGDTRVFIGKKSPVTRSAQLSVMARNVQNGDDEVLIFAIGPKRMDYEKTAKIFKGLE